MFYMQIFGMAIEFCLLASNSCILIFPLDKLKKMSILLYKTKYFVLYQKEGKVKKIVLVSLLTVIIFCLDCATAACGLVASTADGTGPDSGSIAKFNMEEIKTGTPITVHMKDGSKERVKFVGVDSIPFEEYSAKYAKSRENLPDSIILPNLGDTITLALESWGREKVRFFGLGHNYIIISPISDSSIKKVNLKIIEEIYDNNGNEFVIHDIISQSYTPLSSKIIVENQRKMEEIDINEVENIQLNRKTNLMPAALFMGVLVDALTIYLGYVYYATWSFL
jgi:hypothetical protein